MSCILCSYCRHWWNQFRTFWGEFNEHEESMENLKTQQMQQRASPAPPPNAQHHWIPPHHTQTQFSPFMYNPNISQMNANMAPHTPPMNPGIPPEMMMPAEAWYPADTEKGKVQNQSGHGPGMIALSEPQVASVPTQPHYRVPHHMPNTHSPPQNYHPSPSVYSRVPDYVFSNSRRHNHHGQVPSPGYVPLMPRGAELTRKPLPGRSYLASPPNQRVPPPTTFRSKVMSVLGLNPYSDKPPGLKNSGQNVCFLNSVLQCLSHSPGLLQCLTFDSERLRCSNNEAALVTSLTELVQELTSKPGTSEVSVLDPSSVRMAASSLPGSMVTHPTQAQQQQDVSEFLMWLLHTLHNSLNLYRGNKPDSNGSVVGKEMSLSSLNSIIFKMSQG